MLSIVWSALAVTVQPTMRVSTVPILPVPSTVVFLPARTIVPTVPDSVMRLPEPRSTETVSASPLSRMVLLLPVMVMASEVMPSSTMVRPEAVISMLETAPL